MRKTAFLVSYCYAGPTGGMVFGHKFVGVNHHDDMQLGDDVIGTDNLKQFIDMIESGNGGASCTLLNVVKVGVDVIMPEEKT